MPRFGHIVHLLGGLIFLIGATMITGGIVSLIYPQGDEALALWGAAIVTMLAGGAAWHYTDLEGETTIREGFAIVGVGWLLIAAFSALPFWLWGRFIHQAETPVEFASFTDCYFEAMSGLTTTGASILRDVEAIPRGLLWWRAFTHWLGGMGIVVLVLALLPLMGYGVMQLYKAEVPGVTTDKVTPRLRDTAKVLWLVYVILTLIQILLLWGFGHGPMDLFDASCHSFGTLASGGFSNKNASIAAYDSPYAEWVIIFFMGAAGTNFAYHYFLLRYGRLRGLLHSEEFRLYIAILVVATALTTFALYRHSPSEGGIDDIGDAFRAALFQVVSITTTTGFVTADYEKWPALAQCMIFLLLFVGGCAGSTAGGPKVVRHLLLAKGLRGELRKLLYPRAVIPVRLDGRPVPNDVFANASAFVLLYMLSLVAGTVILCAQDIDLLSAFTASASCLGCVGPAFGIAGPVENYAPFDAPSTWTLSFLMLAGRLELFTVIVLLTPAFWRR